MSLEVQFLQFVQVGGHSQRPVWTGGVGAELQAFSWKKGVDAQGPQCQNHLQTSRFWQDRQYVCTGYFYVNLT